MIEQKDQFKQIITKRLEENSKSFSILFEMKHYGNCISIMCQELDQYIRLLFIVNQTESIRDQLMNTSINDQKWSYNNSDNKKIYITDKNIDNFANNLMGWEYDTYEFRNVFCNLTINYNYLLRDPIRSLDVKERDLIYKYIAKYYNTNFACDYTMNELVPVLPMIFHRISESIKDYFVD